MCPLFCGTGNGLWGYEGLGVWVLWRRKKLLIKSSNILGLLFGSLEVGRASSSESARNLGVEIAISSGFIFFQGVAH